jgi:hypothetical protein
MRSGYGYLVEGLHFIQQVDVTCSIGSLQVERLRDVSLHTNTNTNTNTTIDTKIDTKIFSNQHSTSQLMQPTYLVEDVFHHHDILVSLLAGLLVVVPHGVDTQHFAQHRGQVVVVGLGHVLCFIFVFSNHQYNNNRIIMIT